MVSLWKDVIFMGSDRIKLALVCTGGGHFEQMVNLEEFYSHYPHFWITSFGAQTNSYQKSECMYFINIGHFKKPWTYLYQFPKLLAIYLKENPTHVISTGSGRIVFIPFLLSLMFKAKFVHIETFSHVKKLTKMGMFLKRLGCPIFTQWKNLGQSESTYIGPVFKKEPPVDGSMKNEDHIFITLGTREEAFARIIQAVETLRKECFVQDRIIVQAGRTTFQSEWVELFDFGSPEKIDQLIKNSRFVITQESAGVVTKCLKYHKRFIVMPRDYQFRELPAKSDMNEDLHLKLEEMGYTFVVHNIEDMKAAIRNMDRLKVGFNFDNSLAIMKLKKLVES
jgi:UDP-N-acetylglucosamine transferase subunit ALG13